MLYSTYTPKRGWLVNKQIKGKNMKFLKNLLKNKKGATAIEYGLIAALIAVVIIVALNTVGQNVSTTFSTIGSAVGSANL